MTWIAPTPEGRREQFGRFVLGTGNIGGVATVVGPGIGLSDDEGLALIDRGIAEGARIVDTADVYTGGNSERVLGQWRRAHPDSDVLIQSKTGVTPHGPNLKPERLRLQLDRSIDTLGGVDLFIAHAVDPATPWSESLPVLSDAVERGQIRAYGLSNIGEAALSEALATADRLGLARPEIVQNAYSLLVRDDEGSVLRIVRSEGLAYAPYSPLANGILAGRYSRGEQPAVGSRASAAPRVPALLADPAVLGRVRAFDSLAAEHAVSSAGLALAWVLNHPLITAPVIGISKPAQWDALHEALDITWTDALAAAVDDALPARTR